MRLIETCSCGGSIEVIWDEAPRYSSKPGLDAARAKAELRTFRNAHKACSAKQASAGRSSGEAVQATRGTGSSDS